MLFVSFIVCVVRKVRVVDRPANSGAGCSSGRAAGRSRASGGGDSGAAADDNVPEASFQSYDDPDDGESPVPPFKPDKDPGFQLPGHFIRSSLKTANSFLKLFLIIV